MECYVACQDGSPSKSNGWLLIDILFTMKEVRVISQMVDWQNGRKETKRNFGYHFFVYLLSKEKRKRKKKEENQKKLDYALFGCWKKWSIMLSALKRKYDFCSSTWSNWGIYIDFFCALLFSPLMVNMRLPLFFLISHLFTTFKLHDQQPNKILRFSYKIYQNDKKISIEIWFFLAKLIFFFIYIYFLFLIE